MVKDWIVSGDYSKEQIKNLFLQEVENYLNDIGLNTVTYGLPKPLHINNELAYEKTKYNRQDELLNYKNLERNYPSNEKQKEFLEKFILKFRQIQSNKENDAIFMCLTGSGGTGKSNVLQKVAAFVRSQGEICKITASTALAASIYNDATTFHHLIKIPVIDECDKELEYTLELNLTQERLQLLKEVKVIILDEGFFINRECVEAFYNDCRFKKLRGKIFILAGDHKQFLPVYEGGSKHDEISLSITSSDMWKLFKNNIYELTDNMRLQTNDMSESDRKQQESYRNMLYDVGNQENKYTERIYDESDNDDTKTLKLQFQNKFIINNNDNPNHIETVLDDSINWLYESGFNHDNVKNSALIVGTNKEVDTWNKTIQQLNNNETHVLLSTDYLADVDDDKGIIKKMLTTRVLNSKNHSSVPPHELHLKLHDVCILTR
jgi:hypothetical protein